MTDFDTLSGKLAVLFFATLTGPSQDMLWAAGLGEYTPELLRAALVEDLHQFCEHVWKIQPVPSTEKITAILCLLPDRLLLDAISKPDKAAALTLAQKALALLVAHLRKK